MQPTPMRAFSARTNMISDFLPEQNEFRAGLVNAMTVDVEDYFQVSAFERHIPYSDWDAMEFRVERNTNRVLKLFEQAGIKGTFYVLGWVAERMPRTIRKIVEAGHELASHGYSHIRVVNQQPEEFREDVVRTRKLLEDLGGCEVIGYRAASYSIGSGNLWALDILQEAGYRYSSSVYPIRHDLYGMPEAPRFPFRLRPQGILEIPVTTATIAGRKFPCGGGGYFRLFPYAVSKWAIRRVNRRDRRPSMFYFHPWEIDPDQPRTGGIDMKTQFRHYLNLSRMEGRLTRLLRDFSWDRVDRVYSLR